MKKKMIAYIVLTIFLLTGLFLLYSVLKVRLRSPPSFPAVTTSDDSKVTRLYGHVEHLSVKIGSRSVFEYEKLEDTRRYIVSVLEALGYVPRLQTYEYDGKIFGNVIVTIPGTARAGEIILFGAHYDTVRGTPGADDNASAVAVLLELCRAIKDASFDRTVTCVFFTLEEPPIFGSEFMGSYIYARRARNEGEDIRAMVCLEMLGYYSDRKGGQGFPLPFMSLLYSTTPNFIAVVGNLRARSLVKRVSSSLRKSSSMPVETLTAVSVIPGVDLSDHRSFWQIGYPAVMLTDTAFYRNPHYHRAGDTIEHLDFVRMADLLDGVVQAARDLSCGE
jgi:Zn-dependent M28 family amino/carboxypeptidase